MAHRPHTRGQREAQRGSRAAKPPSPARAPLTRASTSASIGAAMRARVESCRVLRAVGLHGEPASRDEPAEVGFLCVLEPPAAAEPVTATVDHAEIRGLAPSSSTPGT